MKTITYGILDESAEVVTTLHDLPFNEDSFLHNLETLEAKYPGEYTICILVQEYENWSDDIGEVVDTFALPISELDDVTVDQIMTEMEL